MNRYRVIALSAMVLLLAVCPAFALQLSQPMQDQSSSHTLVWAVTALGLVGMAVANARPGMSVTPQGAAAPPDINPVLGGVVDRKKWYWWDTLILPPGQQVQQQYSMFAQGIGQQDTYSLSGTQQKTKLNTNINPPGNSFSSPYDMILTNLMFKFGDDVRLYDQELFLKFAYIEFKILDKIFFEGHLWRHPAGAGTTGVTTQSGESVYNNGQPAPDKIYYFGNWSKYIPPLTRFTLTINFPMTFTQIFAGATGTNIPSNINVVGTAQANYPTLLAQGQGGNGMWLVVGMNGLSDGPVQ